MNNIRKYGAATVALALFTGAPAHSASTLSNNNGGDGSVTLIAGGFDLVGSDNGASTNFTLYTNVAGSAGTRTLHWTYTTNDCCGSVWDPAGTYLNGTFSQITVDDTVPGQVQTGSSSFTVIAGDTYGFYIYSPDSVGGRSDIAVTGSVPEPASWALMVAGFGIVGYSLRRRATTVTLTA